MIKLEKKINQMKKPSNQTEAILYHLKNIGSITSWEAMKEYGVTRLSAIIFNLRKDGNDIESIPEKSVNRFGHSVTFAKYTLIPEEKEIFWYSKELAEARVQQAEEQQRIKGF